MIGYNKLLAEEYTFLSIRFHRIIGNLGYKENKNGRNANYLFQ